MDKPICIVCNKPVEEGEGGTATGTSEEGVENASGEYRTVSKTSSKDSFHWKCIEGRAVMLSNGVGISMAENDENTTKH